MLRHFMALDQKFLLLIVILLAPIIPVNHAAAEQASFNQQILPMDCVFQIINDGTGTIVYLTPAACGVIIPPAQNPLPTSPPLPTYQITPLTESLPVKIPSFYGYEYYEPSLLAPSRPMQRSCSADTKLPLLNNFSELKNHGSQTLHVKKNQSFCYQAGNDPTMRDGAYVLTVLAIDPSGVTIDVSYPEKPSRVLGLRAFKIARGQTVEVDLSGDELPDLAFELLDVTPDGQADVKIWRPKKLTTLISSIPQNNTNWVEIWLLVASVLLAIAFIVRFLRRQRARRT